MMEIIDYRFWQTMIVDFSATRSNLLADIRIGPGPIRIESWLSNHFVPLPNPGRRLIWMFISAKVPPVPAYLDASSSRGMPMFSRSSLARRGRERFSGP